MGTNTITAPRLAELAQALRGALLGFEPASLSGAECAAVAEELASTEKACAAARLLAAARAVACGAHKAQGVADPAAWMARQGGTTGSDARGSLELARSMEHHQETKEALLQGAVSVAQAKEIARFADESPGAEHELLELARRADLTQLRDGVRERRLDSARPETLHRRQVAARGLRHWRDGLGMVCFQGALPPETGIPFAARIEHEAQRLHREARRNGSEEPFGAHAADALVSVCKREATGQGGRVDLVVVCDLYAWRRGHAHRGEPCHIVGGGPIPVDLAKELSKDAFLKVVLHDGKDIQRVSHHGRRYTAELETALNLGPVPGFSGRECVDCKRRWGLQHDHTDPVAHTGPTTMANLKDRCYPCHAAKTERDREAGLLGKRAKARGPGPPVKKKPGDEVEGRAPAQGAPARPGAPPPGPAEAAEAS